MRIGVQADSGASAIGAGSGQSADVAGRLLGRLSVLPALLVMAWLLAGLPLLLLGHFTGAAMLIVSVPLAVGAVVLGLRWIPGRWQSPLPAREPGQARTPWWSLVAVVAVAVFFGVDQMIYHSQFIMVTRDPGAYVQFGNWIAGHGSLPIPQDRAAFGSASHLVTFQSFANYQVGQAVVPQFMAGLPMVLAAAFWIGGVAAAAAVSPVLGACAVLAFGGLAARLVGPRWAPLAAAVLALSLPEQFTSRSDYSEPLAQLLFLAGICLIIDSLRADGAGTRVMAALGGLAIGLTLLVRIDAVADMLPVIPYCGLLIISRRPQAFPLLGGLVAGALYGCVDGLVLSRPYLASVKSSLVPLAAIGGVVVIGTLIAIGLRLGKGLPSVSGKWLPNAAAAAVVVVALGFAIRPYVQTVRANSGRSTEAGVAYYQRADHLPVDPTRLYYELSMHWVFWYIGVPAVVLATLGAAVLSRRCLWSQAPAWTLPLLLFGWAIITTLYRPAITPDQPWASRRLVPAVLPGFILLAVWASAWLTGQVRQKSLRQDLSAAVASCCALLLVVPPAITSFGVTAKDGSIVADGLAFKRTQQGEIQAVDSMCAAIPAGSSVVFLSGSPADWLTQIVRGTCGNPAAVITSSHSATVEAALRGIVQAGKRPVLLGSTRSQLIPYGGPIRQVMALRTNIDESALTRPPRILWPLRLNVWMSEPTP